ncbi:MAG: ABC transporter ATP-binding protein [Muribaculaceae bacterium]|nr:ABC transporter ATP-binding protein [Muribaculaceae bacterium]
MDNNQKPIAIELRHLSLGFKGRELLTDVSARFRAGELTALLGRNGAGKSTLLRAIAGLNRDYSGDIVIEGSSSLTPRERARLIAYVATRRERLGEMTVGQLVALGRAPMTNWLGTLREADKEAVDEAIATVGLSELANRKVDSLSDGEAQRAMIARGIAQDTPIMLLDEPTSFLDLPSRETLACLLKDIALKGKTVIFTTHELELAQRYCDRIALIDSQRLLYGSPAEMAPLINKSFNLNLI